MYTNRDLAPKRIFFAGTPTKIKAAACISSWTNNPSTTNPRNLRNSIGFVKLVRSERECKRAKGGTNKRTRMKTDAALSIASSFRVARILTTDFVLIIQPKLQDP